ncbi:MAG: signal peptidase II [candidate division NC10 bacterium]
MRMLFYYVALTVILLDQATKLVIVEALRVGQGIPVIPGFFDIVFVLNPGAAFGFLATLSEGVRNPFFILITVVAVILIVFYHTRFLHADRLASVALGLILGGAIGNLIDRLRYGMVVDFLDFHVSRYHWPAFNVADSAISIGVSLMFLDMLLDWRREKRRATTETANERQ